MLKHCCVDDPADLCVFNVVDKGLVEANKEDLNLFINVAIVNAGEWNKAARSMSGGRIDYYSLVSFEKKQFIA